MHLLLVSLLAAAPGAGPRPNVLLVTIDTLRPDALGWAGGSNATPVLDRLAAEGCRFPAAVSPAPITLPSHASMMTGLLPRHHGLRDNGQSLPGGLRTLAESLRAQGYATGGFVSGFPLSRAFGLARGFEHFDDRLPDGPPDRRERRAEATALQAAAWIRAAHEPWLAWVHFYDPHDPYEPPQALLRPGPRGAYDGEVAYVDQALGGLLAGLASDLRQRLLTVVASDHGESLGEHGESTHGFFVYESTVAVPLVFHAPGRVAPRASRAPVGLVDLAPTVLELAGADPLGPVDGQSLVPLLSGRSQALPPAYVESLRPWASYGWSPLRALRAGDWKLIVAPRAELFDLAGDPGESRNLIEREPARADRLGALLERSEAGPARSAAAVLDPRAAERLQALGYVGAGTSGAPPEAPKGLADPKDRIDAWNALGAAEALLGRRDFGAALLAFDRVLASDPSNRFALSRSGVALLELGRAEPALLRLRKALEVGPEHPEARLALAQALGRLGRHAEAAAQWMELVRVRPRSTADWVGLGNALGRAGRADEAASALAHAVELEPGEAELRVRLAFAEHAAGRKPAAAAQLLEASRLSPPGRFAHGGALGLLLSGLGRTAEARSWLEASRAGEGDFAEARVELARLCAAAGDAQRARAALREALAAAPALRRRLAADPTLAPLLP